MGVERLSRDELLELDYESLQQLLAMVCDEMLDIHEKLPAIEAQYRELRAQERVLAEVKSMLQSLIRAQRDVL